jgi:hypothetical protein
MRNFRVTEEGGVGKRDPSRSHPEVRLVSRRLQRLHFVLLTSRTGTGAGPGIPRSSRFLINYD